MPRRKRKSKEPRVTAKDGQTKPASGGSSAAINIALSAVIAVGLAYTFWPQQKKAVTGRAVTPPPPLVEITKDGTRFSRFDQDALVRWSRSVGLPEPPQLDWMEPQVAGSLLLSLKAVARKREGDALGKVGQIFESLECHDVAESYFKLAEEEAPKTFRWPYYRACIYQLVGRHDDAMSAFLHAEKLDPEYPTLHARVGQLHLDVAELDAAKQRFETYRRLQPNDSLGLVGLGRIAIAEGRYDEAVNLLLQAVALRQSDFQSHFYLADAYRRQGRDEDARKHFDISAELPQGKWFYMRDPLDQELHRVAGSSQALVSYFEQLAGSRNYNELARIAEQILARRPRDTMMLTNLAGIYRKIGRNAEAHELLDRAEEVQPELARIWSVRSTVFLGEGRNEESVAAAEQAIRLGGPSLEAVNVKGRAQLLLGRYALSALTMGEAVNIAPRNVGNIFVYGEALRMAGQLEEALAQYRRCLEIDPNYPPAVERLQQLQDQ